tara:strand:- start:11423 stop:11728 length:306 start_codon:yes stop_codon:yes gene_type:complete
MNRRGNCHYNAVAESFFSILRRERIKRQIYFTLEAARRDVFNYIEMFYNPKCRLGTSDNLSPAEYEKRYFRNLTGVYNIQGDSLTIDPVFIAFHHLLLVVT